MRLKRLVPLITLIQSRTLEASLSISGFLQELSEEQSEVARLVALSKDRSCILRVLVETGPKCHVEEGYDQRITALELTRCVFESNAEMPNLPLECHLGRDIDACIGQVAHNGILWTTYFGYLNLVESFCSYYNHDLNQLRAMNEYSTILTTLHDLIIRYDNTSDAHMAQMASRMLEMTNNIQNQFQILVTQLDESKRRLEELELRNMDFFERQWNEVDTKLTHVAEKVSKEQRNMVVNASRNLNQLVQDHKTASLQNIIQISATVDKIVAQKLLLAKNVSLTELASIAAVVIISIVSGQSLFFVAGLAIGVHVTF